MLVVIPAITFYTICHGLSILNFKFFAFFRKKYARKNRACDSDRISAKHMLDFLGNDAGCAIVSYNYMLHQDYSLSSEHSFQLHG